MAHPPRPAVSRAAILEVLRGHFGVAATELALLAGGLDEDARTYRVTVDTGMELALRLAVGDPRPSAYAAPRRLRDLGADAVVAPLPTTGGQLFVEVHGLTWSLYPFIEGVDGWTRGMSDSDWRDLGVALRTVHDASPAALVVRRDAFDVTPYEALATWDGAVGRSMEPDDPRRGFAEAWQAHHDAMAATLERMRVLAAFLRDRPRNDVLCHGDLHPGNVLFSDAGVHILDWGDVLLAPRERDFIFVPHQGALGVARPLATSFLSGYGVPPDDIDWPALAYYRCERVLQDVIAWAESVFGRTGAEDFGPAVHWLLAVFEPGGEVDAVRDACRHLPPHLDVLR